MSIKYNGGYIPAVGADGTTLVANSASATGVAWAGPSVAAGKNAIINGGFDIWQRGTSFTTSAWGADRWFFYYSSNAGTYTRITSPITGFNYSLQYTSNAATSDMSVIQPIETANSLQFANKIVTLSFYIATSNSANITADLYYSTATDASWTGTGYTTITSTAGSNSVTTTSTSTLKTLTFSVPSSTRTLKVAFYNTTAGAMTTSSTATITGVQLELGSVATAFSRAGGTLQGELAACQRYYQKSFNIATAPAQNLSTGNMVINASAYGSSAQFFIRLPVTMRAAPTVTTYNPYAANASWRLPSSSTDVAITISNSNEGTICGTAASTTATAMHTHWSADSEL